MSSTTEDRSNTTKQPQPWHHQRTAGARDIAPALLFDREDASWFMNSVHTEAADVVPHNPTARRLAVLITEAHNACHTSGVLETLIEWSRLVPGPRMQLVLEAIDSPSILRALGNVDHVDEPKLCDLAADNLAYYGSEGRAHAGTIDSMRQTWAAATIILAAVAEAAESAVHADDLISDCAVAAYHNLFPRPDIDVDDDAEGEAQP